MSCQSIAMDELKHDLDVNPDHGAICNGNMTDMDVVVEAETKLNGEINGEGVNDVSFIVPGDADKENETPADEDIVNGKSNGDMGTKALDKHTHSEVSTKKQGKPKRRSSSSSSSTHKRPKPKPTATTSTSTVSMPSSSKSVLFGLLSYNDYQTIRDPIVAFETSLATTKNWITWLRLELIELWFDSTWDQTNDDEETTLRQQHQHHRKQRNNTISQVIGECVLIGYSLADFVTRFWVVFIVAVIKLYLHLVRGVFGVGMSSIGLTGLRSAGEPTSST
ncbi:hypothetical protein CANMA_002112 [Candida margitis]|uniref:uncharacterized protein n=1 Tax=Candida margitis TaxID=1775924 RepID=UPI002226B3DD|nr:uncharacterized protein CANMA_002112 [Candida margitis]KAI5968676.1 hypothetical protein CANMA_002112 [Candida margitis]